MNTVAFTSALCLLVAYNSLTAQDLHVYYDAHSKNITYTSQGDTIWRPKVRKGAQIFLHVQNFNNFLYELELKTDSETIAASSGSTAGLLPLGSGGLSSLLGGSLNPIQRIAQQGLNNTEDFDFQLSGFGGDAAALQALRQLKDRFNSTLQAIFRTEKRLEAINGDVDAYLEGQVINEIIRTELEHLKRNPRLQPQQIRSLSLEYLQKIFPSEQSNELTLSALLEQSDPQQQLREYWGRLVEEETDYTRSARNLSLIARELDVLSVEGNSFSEFRAEVRDVETNAQKVAQTLTENKERLATIMATAPSQNIQHLTALRYEYEAISANDFSETFRLEAEGDLTILNLTFSEKRTAEDTEPARSESIPPIKIPVAGGLKVNAALGISFGGYWDHPQIFFIRDSLISSESEDGFTPLLTSFVHFYPLSAGQVSLGGSIGVGIPITGADKQAISFLLGPCLVIGRGERIVISGGLMGGKVEKLSAGYQVGDTFELSIENIPKRSVYQLGYFLGLSFNLTGG